MLASPRSEQHRQPLYDTVFFDLDGTLHLSGTPFPGVVDFINNRHRLDGTTFVAVTNNTSMVPEKYRDKLLAMGLEPAAFDICSPLNVIVEENGGSLPRDIFAVATDEVRAFLKAHGFNLNRESAAAVLSTFDTELCYSELTQACQILHSGAPLYATHIDIRCPTANGFIPDCGAITNLLSSVSGVEPVCDFGKPSKKMADFLGRKYLREGSRAVMVGDRLYTDIALGKFMRIDTTLVLSGEVSSFTMTEQDQFTPTHVFPSFLEFLEAVYAPQAEAARSPSYADI